MASINKALLASASSDEFPLRIPNVPYVRYEKGKVHMERNAQSFERTVPRPSTAQQQWGLDVFGSNLASTSNSRAPTPNAHPFAQPSVNFNSSQFSSTQIGMHRADGKRLAALREQNHALFRRAVDEQNARFRICAKTTLKRGNHPDYDYPHTFQKLLNAGRRTQREPTPETWRCQKPAGTADGLLEPFRTKTLREADARSTFTTSYRARQKDHIAHGKEPMHMGDTPDERTTTSLYGFKHIGSTTAGRYKRILAEDARARASYR
eukprot:g4988.t1